MPQMSPLMWDILFMVFSVLLLLSLIKVYYTFMQNVGAPNREVSAKKTNSMTWMW